MNAEPGKREPEGRDEIGFGLTVRCKQKGLFYDFEWTYKENGLLDKPKCQGCGKLFDINGDEEHAIFSVS